MPNQNRLDALLNWEAVTILTHSDCNLQWTEDDNKMMERFYGMFGESPELKCANCAPHISEWIARHGKREGALPWPDSEVKDAE